MNRITFIGIAAALALSNLSPAPASAAEEKGGKPWQTEICQHHVKIGIFKNMGECMARVKQGAERYCSYLERIGYFDRPNARWKNKGQCMSWYRTRK